jgi:hypothetical protein
MQALLRPCSFLTLDVIALQGWYDSSPLHIYESERNLTRRARCSSLAAFVDLVCPLDILLGEEGRSKSMNP